LNFHEETYKAKQAELLEERKKQEEINAKLQKQREAEEYDRINKAGKRRK
jgi:hypothetical protein